MPHTNGTCESCAKLMTESSFIRLKNWKKQWRFCSYKCYYSKMAEGDCIVCKKLITKPSLGMAENCITGKFEYCSRRCYELDFCKQPRPTKYDEPDVLRPCCRCIDCKKCVNCEKCECCDCDWMPNPLGGPEIRDGEMNPDCPACTK